MVLFRFLWSKVILFIIQTNGLGELLPNVVIIALFKSAVYVISHVFDDTIHVTTLMIRKVQGHGE